MFETAAVGTSVVQVQAIDRDHDKNAEIKYSILSGESAASRCFGAPRACASFSLLRVVSSWKVGLLRVPSRKDRVRVQCVATESGSTKRHQKIKDTVNFFPFKQSLYPKLPLHFFEADNLWSVKVRILRKFAPFFGKLCPATTLSSAVTQLCAIKLQGAVWFVEQNDWKSAAKGLEGSRGVKIAAPNTSG